ncbi:MAG: hypothetical protein ACFE9I_00030, partial [Candidatus Hermodarchaeota archaeon]
MNEQNNNDEIAEDILSTNTYENKDHTIIIFDHEYSNSEHPAIKTIKIPGEPISCIMEIVAYCDPDDIYLRAVYFALDDIGDPIGVERIGAGQVRGDVTIRGGETKTWEFDMSNCQFAKPSPETGSYFRNFIPQTEENFIGFFSPGEHTVKAFVTSQNSYKGATQDSWITIKLHFIFKEIVVSVLDHVYSNADHPSLASINIPTTPMYCRMQITAYCDPDDIYLRAVYFALDDIGDPIGVERIGAGQVRGDVTIRGGETKTWEFDMSNCQFAKPSPETGSYFRNFIPQTEDDFIGFFSPGEHTIKAFVTSQDIYKGATQDSWITVKLFFLYDEFILDVFEHEFSNADHPALTNIKIPCLSRYCRMQITAYCDPDDPYLRAVYFALDDIGDPIGVERIGVGQVRGDVTIQGGETKTWEFDMSNCQFAKPSPETGSYFRNFIPQTEVDLIGFFSPGEHTVKAFVTSQDAYKDPIPKLAQVEGQDSWISIKLYFIFIEDPTPPVINIDYLNGAQTDENPGRWKISAEEDICCIDESSIKVIIDGILAGNLLSVYNVPNTLGFHTISVELKNTHPRKPLSSSKSSSINIIDDDITPPKIDISYTGDGTDGNPGTFVVSASDASGLSGDPTGIYPVPNSLGTYVFAFIARDNDNDRPGDSLTTTITTKISLVDDDTTLPKIDISYTGDGTDGNPGTLVVSASDASGLFADPTGIYPVPNSLGTHDFTFSATDNDNDRPGDSLTTTITTKISLVDDDTTLPKID